MFYFGYLISKYVVLLKRFIIVNKEMEHIEVVKFPMLTTDTR